MPFSKNSDLPSSVADNLPSHAEDIYREAFNSAYKEYDKESERRDGKSREATAHSVAWAAVKKKYEKVDGKWKKK